MKLAIFVLALLAITDIVLPFAITFRESVSATQDANNSNKRQKGQSSQIVFEPEPTQKVKTTTTKRPITSPVPVLKLANLLEPATNYTEQTVSTTAATKNETDTPHFNATITEASAENSSVVTTTANSCQPENVTTLSYLSEDFIRSKLCSNINSTLSREYRFDLDAKVCSQVGRQSHCGKNMVFYSFAGNKVYGHCDCDYSSAIPLVYHPQTNRCYFLYQQGYCLTEEWLVMEKGNRTASCAKNMCYNHGRRGFGAPPLAARDMAPEYVPLRGVGPCVRLNHPNEQHCNNKTDDVVTFRWPRTLYPICSQPLSPEGPTATGRFLGDVASLRCNPGLYMSSMGVCQPSWEFDDA